MANLPPNLPPLPQAISMEHLPPSPRDVDTVPRPRIIFRMTLDEVKNPVENPEQNTTTTEQKPKTLRRLLLAFKKCLCIHCIS